MTWVIRRQTKKCEYFKLLLFRAFLTCRVQTFYILSQNHLCFTSVKCTEMCSASWQKNKWWLKEKQKLLILMSDLKCEKLSVAFTNRNGFILWKNVGFWQGLREVKIVLLTRNETSWKASHCGTEKYRLGQDKQLERGIAGKLVLWRIGDQNRIGRKGIELCESQMWKAECGTKILILDSCEWFTMDGK